MVIVSNKWIEGEIDAVSEKCNAVQTDQQLVLRIELSISSDISMSKGSGMSLCFK